jgi:hypothetical protein
MPFTPFHMGAGLAVKAVVSRKFSLLIFGWAQILTDLQPLMVIITGHGMYHGLSHTYLGATGLGLLTAVSGKYLTDLFFRLIKQPQYADTGWRVAFFSAYIGTYSHVLIDSITHRDVRPFTPFSDINNLPGRVSTSAMEIFLVICGVAGAVVLYLLREQLAKK